MSTMRNISPGGMSNNKRMLSSPWNLIKSTIDANRIHIVYDSYLEETIKESVRIHSSAEVGPPEYISLSLLSRY